MIDAIQEQLQKAQSDIADLKKDVAIQANDFSNLNKNIGEIILSLKNIERKLFITIVVGSLLFALGVHIEPSVVAAVIAAFK